MNDEEFEKQKQRIRALAERWVKPLGLSWGRIHTVYERDSGNFNDSRQKYCNTPRDGTGQGLAFCSSDWRYAESSITFNMLLIAGQEDDELEETFVHELMHIFLNEMREDGIDHEERVATSLAKAFVWLRDALKEEQEQPAILTEVSTC